MQLELIKCPQCGNPRGHKALDHKKLWFLCHVCGLQVPLNLLASYRKDLRDQQRIPTVCKAAT